MNLLLSKTKRGRTFISMACGCASPASLPPLGHTQGGVQRSQKGGQNGESRFSKARGELSKRAEREQSPTPGVGRGN